MIVDRDSYRALRKFGKLEVERPMIFDEQGNLLKCILATGRQYPVRYRVVTEDDEGVKVRKVKGEVTATVARVERADEHTWKVFLEVRPIVEPTRLMQRTAGETEDPSLAVDDGGVKPNPEFIDRIAAVNDEQIKARKLAWAQHLREGIDPASAGLATEGALTRRERRHLAEIEHHIGEFARLQRERKAA